MPVLLIFILVVFCLGYWSGKSKMENTLKKERESRTKEDVLADEYGVGLFMDLHRSPERREAFLRLLNLYPNDQLKPEWLEIKNFWLAQLKVEDDYNRNPYEISVEETIRRFKNTATKQGWSVGEDVYERLAASAPAWPKGRLAFRSLRIRFGEGREGMIQTFETHAKVIKETFEPKFQRWNYLLSGEHVYQKKPVDRLRLLAGNETHKPAIEWCVFDLDSNRYRESIAAVRSPKASLADEGLVFAWLFSQYTSGINYQDKPAFFLGGYELNVPGSGSGPWRGVPCVCRDVDAGEVRLDALWRSRGDSRYSVPALRE